MVWKNVRKIRSREKQMELEDWMSTNGYDICAVSETGLNGNEYVEVGKNFKWYGVNRGWMKGKSGGVGFVIKRELSFMKIQCICEDICFIKVGEGATEWLIGCVYMNCEGVRKEENAERVSKVKECIAKECKDGTKVEIGGDINGHIWELDKCENANGKLMKELTYEAGQTIVNCEWEGMNEPTWFMNDKEYTLDYILVNEKGYGCIREAGVMDTNEVVESDHAAVWMKVGVSARDESRHNSQKKSRRKKKNKLRKSQMEEYGNRVEEREMEDYQDMIKILTEVEEDMNDDKRIWKEDRSGWFNEEVKRSIQERKKVNREYRFMRKVCGTGDARITKAKRDYESKKYEARTMIERALNAHNENVMSEIGINGDSKALYTDTLVG